MPTVLPDANPPSTRARQTATLRAAADLMEVLGDTLPEVTVSANALEPDRISISMGLKKRPVALASILRWLDALHVGEYQEYLGSTGKRFVARFDYDGTPVEISANFYDADAPDVRTVTR